MSEENRKSPITLKDIATMIGVDASTVSRAINHPDKVKAATLQKIKQHIKDLNYHPNLVARGLQAAKSNLLAMVVPNFSNLAFAKIAKGFHDALKGTNYELIICSSLEDTQEEIEISNALLRQRVSGIVFVGTVSTYENDIPFDIFKDNIEVLVIDREVHHEHINVFLLDAYHGIKMALNHLQNLGHSRIAIITGHERSIQAKLRIDLIRSILNELEIIVPEVYIRQGDWTAAGGWHAMEDLLNLDLRPTAVFAITDTMAMGAIGAACAAGLRIPQDLSIVGFNNEPGSESFNPPLTTIGPHAYNIGIQAGRFMLDHQETKTNRRVIKRFPLDLIIRKTTAQPPVPANP
jgi:DNA-binding LacI/PurR family transcriptional regulator